jgi:hypothetical protein
MSTGKGAWVRVWADKGKAQLACEEYSNLICGQWKGQQGGKGEEPNDTYMNTCA